MSEFLPPVVADLFANVTQFLSGFAEADAAVRAFAATVEQVAAVSTESFAALTAGAESVAAGAASAATVQADSAAASTAAVEAGSNAIVAANERAAASTITLRQAMAEVTASAEVQAVTAAQQYGTVEAKTAAMAATTEAMAVRAAAANERVGAAMAGTATTSTVSSAAVVSGLQKAGVAFGILGAAVIHEAGDFESATNRLVTSAGETHETIGMVRQGMLDMAGQVGYSAEELVAAMYKVSSGGQIGAKGLDVLRASAEGAKAENADLAVVADAVTSVLQDYVAKNYSAAEVTSKLVAATAAGKTTFEELSRSLSAVLPIASAAHVSLDDVLGSLASMTVHGMSAQQATQNMANAIRAMEKPTQVQAKELGQLGMSAQDLAGMLSEKGLSGTVQHLSELILSHMGPSGKVMLDAFNQSKDAAKAAKEMIAAMPQQVQHLAQQYQAGTISLGDYAKAMKALPSDQAELAKQYASLQDRARGFSDQLKSGTPAAQNYTEALGKVMGGATGLNVALMLTGDNTEYVNHAVKAIAGTTAEAGGHVRGWADIQSTFNQKMDEAKSGLGALAIQIGTILLPAVSTIADMFAGATHWLAAHKVAAEILAGVVGGGLVIAFSALLAVFWGFASNPVTWIIAGIIVAVGALALGVYELIKHWSAVAQWFSDLWQTIKTAFSTAIDWIVGIFKGWYPLILGILSGGVLLLPALIIKYWDNIVAFFKSLLHKAIEALSALGSFLASVASTAWHAFLGAITTGAHAVLDFFKNLPYMIAFAISFLVVSLLKAGQDAIHALGTGLRMAWSFVVFFFTELPGKIDSFLADAASWLVDKGWDLLVGLWHGIQNAWNTIADFFTSIPGKLKAWFGQAQTWLTSEGVEILVGVGEGISQGWTNVQNWFSELPGKVKNFLSGAGNWLVEAGKDLVRGLWHGIQSLGGWIADQVSNFAHGLLDGAKAALGIASPSKAMADVGMWMVHGLAAGLDNHTHVAVKAAQSMANQVVGAMSGMEATASLAVRGGDGVSLPSFTAAAGLSFPSAPPGGSGGVQVTNIDITVQGSVLTERDLVDAVQKGLLRRGIRNTGNGVTYTTLGG